MNINDLPEIRKYNLKRVSDDLLNKKLLFQLTLNNYYIQAAQALLLVSPELIGTYLPNLPISWETSGGRLCSIHFILLEIKGFNGANSNIWLFNELPIEVQIQIVGILQSLLNGVEPTLKDWLENARR